MKTEGESVGGAQKRLALYVAALLVLGAVIVGIAKLSAKKGPERLPGAPAAPDAPAGPTIDVARLPAGDGPAVHARYQPDGLDYLLTVVDRDFTLVAKRVSPEAVQALSPAQARGEVFEVRGRVEEIVREEYADPSQRLWSVLLAGSEGGRTIVLKHGLESDHREGRPEDALRGSTEFVEVGDDLLVRGIYLQRRTGSIGTAILRDPVPVLVATPPTAAFRKMPPEAAVPIADPTEADWDEIRDRYLNETQVWEEPALFQIVQWARRRGHDAIQEDIRSGAIPHEPWDRELFDRWGAEVELADASAPRPLTESLRGRLFRTTGFMGSFQREGWATIPREGSAWGVDSLYVLDVLSDYWGNQAIRSFTPFPLETFTHDVGDVGQRVALYGYFLKNYTYKTRKVRGGTVADVTMPMFVVLHVEALREKPSAYGPLIWIISGSLVVLAVIFYLGLVRGEKREAARMDSYRRGLRKRIRRHAESPPPAPAPPEDEAGA